MRRYAPLRVRRCFPSDARNWASQRKSPRTFRRGHVCARTAEEALFTSRRACNLAAPRRRGSTSCTLRSSLAAGSPSSRGPGHRPFTAVTGVRIPLGTPINQRLKGYRGADIQKMSTKTVRLARRRFRVQRSSSLSIARSVSHRLCGPVAAWPTSPNRLATARREPSASRSRGMSGCHRRAMRVHGLRSAWSRLNIRVGAEPESAIGTKARLQFLARSGQWPAAERSWSFMTACRMRSGSVKPRIAQSPRR